MATGPWGGLLDQRVFRVKIAFKLGQSNCQTGFHLRDVGVNTLDPADVVDLVRPWADVNFRALLKTTDSLVGVDAENLVSKEGASHSFTTTAGSMAVDATTAGPSFLMVPISLKGERRTRYGQGRMLWPVVNDLHTSENAMTAAGQTLFQGAIDELAELFIGPAITTSAHMINLHELLPATRPHTGPEPLPEVPATWYDVTSIRLNTTISSLRSRKVNVGS
jgi:hypothetical protein